MSQYSELHTLFEFVPDQIWIQTIPFRFLGINIGARMSVIRLNYPKLFIHSPVELDRTLKSRLDQLGSVNYVVSPNHYHHLFLGDFYDEYPNAYFYASPGLVEKRKDIRFRFELKDHPEEEWKDHLDQMIFMGPSSMQDVVFFHRESRTLIVADLLMNFGEDSTLLTRLICRVFGIYKKVFSPLDFKLSKTEKVLARTSKERLLQWDFDKIILSHGQVIEHDGKRILQEAFLGVLD